MSSRGIAALDRDPERGRTGASDIPMSVGAKSLSGPSAGSVKYDLLTMLSIAGLHSTVTMQASMLRLIALITARYNWRNDELSVGQRDMAKMWCVNERTVKREIKRLTEAKILICKRPGVRGRVGAYRLNQAEIARLSRPAWDDVGPDFAYRMEERYRMTETKIVPLSPQTAQVFNAAGEWGAVLGLIQKENPDAYAAWFAHLVMVECADRVLTLRGPNQFKLRYIETQLMDLLMSAVRQVLGPIDRVVMTV